MNDTLTAPENIESRLQMQIGRIDEAIARIRQNEITDVSALESDVNDICKQLNRLEPEAARKLEPQVIAVISRLEELAAELQAYQDRIGDKSLAPQQET